MFSRFGFCSATFFGFIPQLVEPLTGNAEDMDSNPIGAVDLFFLVSLIAIASTGNNCYRIIFSLYSGKDVLARQSKAKPVLGILNPIWKSTQLNL